MIDEEMAEEWVKENMDCVKTVSCLNHDCNYFSDEERSIAKSAFKDGYNKANEWHYPSKGQLPKDLCLVIAYFWELGKKQVREVYFDSKYFCYHGNHIEPVAWQYYPVPPKEDK